MSIVDEQDLRLQLDAVLDAITPPEAPVSAAARKGKLIQAGRSLGIVAGLAVVAGIGVGIPGLLNQPAREVSHARPMVVVRQTCTTEPRDRGPGDSLMRGRPAAEIAAGGCAWLRP